MKILEDRKKDHIELAFKSQIPPDGRDPRFHYEPMLAAHPRNGLPSTQILGKELKVPLWVSSMTGGTRLAGTINRNLARACAEFGMGMGLGSCRILLESDRYLDDFRMRPLIGKELPLWANLGIAQVEELLAGKTTSKAARLVDKLEADGLIIHVNPMQEWFQPEGDILKRPPIDSIAEFLEAFPHPVIVKEVGQGMGPRSLEKLLDLPLQAIEFAAFGGTNFAKAELLRDENGSKDLYKPLSYVGEDALSMVEHVNALVEKKQSTCGELIISGGIRTFLDGYYLIRKSRLPAVYGMASAFLKHAREGYAPLREYVQSQISGLEMANTFLDIRE